MASRLLNSPYGIHFYCVRCLTVTLSDLGMTNLKHNASVDRRTLESTHNDRRDLPVVHTLQVPVPQFEIQMLNQLRHQLRHLKHTDILPNARPTSQSKWHPAVVHPCQTFLIGLQPPFSA